MKGLIKKLLKESLFHANSKEQIDLMSEFIEFISKELQVEPAKTHLKFDRDGLTTTAAYGDKKVFVYAKERAVVDIMRSIAHEFVHLQQDVNGKLNPDDHEADTETGSLIENEANYKAGQLIRKFGELHPEIYE